MKKTGLNGLAALLLGSLFTGCLQIETHIQLHKDGNATVTERVHFSQRLMDLAKKAGPKSTLEPLLQK